MEDVNRQGKTTPAAGEEQYNYPLLRQALMAGFAPAGSRGDNAGAAQAQGDVADGGPSRVVTVQPDPQAVARIPRQEQEPEVAPPLLRMADVASLRNAGLDAAMRSIKPVAPVLASQPPAATPASASSSGTASAATATKAPTTTKTSDAGAAKPATPSGGGTAGKSSTVSGGAAGSASTSMPPGGGAPASSAPGSATPAAKSGGPAGQAQGTKGNGAQAASGQGAANGSAKPKAATVAAGKQSQPANQGPTQNAPQSKPPAQEKESWFDRVVHQAEDLLHIPRGTVQTQGQNKSQTLDPNAKRGAVGSPQYNLVQAQDAARADHGNQPEKGTTHCNRATFQVVKAMGGDTGPFAKKRVGKDGKETYDLVNANQQCANLAAEAKNPKGSYRAITEKEAIELARQGKVVIAAQPHEGHGHVATVRPDNLETEKVETRGQALMSNVGGHVGVNHRSGVFYKNPPVVYYVQR